MVDHEFANGNEVRHKSGGPRMVVVAYDHHGVTTSEKTYKCRWFNDKNQVQEACFTQGELKSATATSAAPRMRFVTTRKGF